MSVLTLTLRALPPHSVDVSPLIPDRLAGLNKAAVENIARYQPVLAELSKTGRTARCRSSISPACRYCRTVETPPPRRTSRPPAAALDVIRALQGYGKDAEPALPALKKLKQSGSKMAGGGPRAQLGPARFAPSRPSHLVRLPQPATESQAGA